MREVVKLFLAVGAIASVVWGFVAWVNDRPTSMVWVERVGAPITMVGCILLYRAIKPRPDLAPNYLATWVGPYFERGGFCFALTTGTQDGLFVINAFYQNQFDQRRDARIAIRPSQQFFLNRAAFPPLEVDIEAEPGEFGVARFTVPVPINRQGKKQGFEVGATVTAPEGKGNRLRFGIGNVLRTNARFQNKFGTGLALFGLLGGMIVTSKPATVTINLPMKVDEAFDQPHPPQVRTLWRLGDPPLQVPGLSSSPPLSTPRKS